MISASDFFLKECVLLSKKSDLRNEKRRYTKKTVGRNQVGRRKKESDRKKREWRPH